ncbi:carboxypeptidase regulatory-like domain-containing protein [Runella sp.]|uniref:carboxypeptidase regulatory-like domain-containing protein n=1 Tax=Runella sp. TaxID=1960881 RepID=UPI00261D11D8|nr:carboxypeptidase regulatory-like domain-containing protein [Runella sp.]
MRNILFKTVSGFSLALLYGTMLLNVILLKAQDSPREASAARISGTTVNEPTLSDELFVGTLGGDFDKYLFRKDVPNGRLTFNVDITRYYSNRMKFDAQGFLTNVPELVERGLIPKMVRLTMRIYDVDHNSQYDGNGDGIADPEIDYVYVNGKLITTTSGQIWTLGSGNNTWSTPSIMIPIEYIKFPSQTGNANTLPKAENSIQIAIDVPNTTYWAIECDWISINIESKALPLVFVRGFGIASGGIGDTPSEIWQNFADFAARDGIPFHIAQSLDPCGGIIDNGNRIGNEIAIAKNTFGTQKINLVAHSKGGLDSRAYLRWGTDVKNLVQLGTPNHGSRYAHLSAWCDPAGDQLEPGWLADNFNYQDSDLSRPLFNPELDKGTAIYQFTARDDFWVSAERATLPWRATYNQDASLPLIGISDAVFFGLGHTDLRLNPNVFLRIMQRIYPGVKSGARISAEQGKQTITSIPDSLGIVFMENNQLLSSSIQIRKVYIPIAGIAFFQGIFQAERANYTLKSPSGKIYNTNNAEYSNSDGFLTYKIPNSEAGIWEITFTGGSTNGLFSMRVHAQSNQKLTVKTNKSKYLLQEPIGVNAILTSKNGPVSQAKGVVYFTKGSFIKDSLQLFDDGLHNDGKANDGNYGNSNAGFSEVGSYSLVIKLQKNSESIYQDDVITVFSSSGGLNNTYKEKAIDKNNDVLYDSLQIRVGFLVKVPGNFSVIGSLRDAQGKLIGTTSWNHSRTKPLSVGNYEAILNFNGEAIGKNGLNGPFILDDLSLIDLSNSIAVDNRKKAYTTQAYQITSFPRPPIELTGKNAETPIDSDKDGDFDFLDIKLQIKVNRSGFYTISAELIDSLQNSLNWSEKSLNLSVGLNEVTMRFAGDEINEKLANGPYILTNLYFNSSLVSLTFYDVYKTNAYKFSNFTGNFITGSVKEKFTGTPIADATIVLKGAKLVTIKSDAKGFYTIAGLPNGSYNIEARKDNFCSSIIMSLNKPQDNTAIELLLTNKKFSLGEKKNIQICQGDSIRLTAPNGWQNYQWSNGNKSSNITVTIANQYFVTTTLQNCQAFSDTIVVGVTIIPKPTINSDGVVTLTSSIAESYQWFKEGTLIQGAIMRNFMATEPGKYSVKIASKGCFNTSDAFNLIITAIQPPIFSNLLLLYPNPSSEWLRIIYRSEEIAFGNIKAHIYDLQGILISRHNLQRNTEGWEGNIFIKALPIGKYVLRLEQYTLPLVSKTFNKQ